MAGRPAIVYQFKTFISIQSKLLLHINDEFIRQFNVKIDVPDDNEGEPNESTANCIILTL